MGAGDYDGAARETAWVFTYDGSAPAGFLKWGPMMPAISIDDEPWFLESTEILCRLGYSQVADEDMLAIRQAWTGVMHRTDYWPRFWGEFSLASDPNPNLARRFVNNFLRAFTILCSLYLFGLVFSVVGMGDRIIMPTLIFTGKRD